jgi:hypothetical protein
MAVDTTGAAPEQPSAGHRTVPPDGPGISRPAAGPRRRRARLVAALALTAGAVAVWELGAIHDDGPLFGGAPGGSTSCHSRPEADVVDFTVGDVVADPTRDVRILDIRAVGAQNAVVREGWALPLTGDRDGDGTRTVFGLGSGYPPDLTGTDLVWAQGEPLVGALLVHEAPVNLVWRVEVRDEAQDASYDAVEIEYRSGHRRYVAVVDHDLLLPGGVDPEACFSR